MSTTCTGFPENNKLPLMTGGPVRQSVYPFSAIAGQERMKKALLLNAVCPSIGGVLLRGEKGTAKSTAVRALSALLPEIEVVAGCPYGCDPGGHLCFQCREHKKQGSKLPVAMKKVPIVNLPLGVTEDRVTGAIDLEEAIKQGKKRLQRGLLAEAHRGILYIDEVNLLNDHIVDIILDASAMGMNIVEREGISLAHPSEFILVGTMNPEEGELRPQLLDRFGLCVEVETPSEVELRLNVLKLRERFDNNADIFIHTYRTEQKQLMQKIAKARKLLARIRISEQMLRLCSQLSIQAFTAGHRADITIHNTARAIAALNEQEEVREEDVRSAAKFVLVHRTRMAPPPPQPPEPEHNHDQQQNKSDEQPQEEPPPQPSENDKSEKKHAEKSGNEDRDSKESQSQIDPAIETIFPVGSPFRIKSFSTKKDRIFRKGSGRRTRSRTVLKTGRYVKSRQNDHPCDLALDATIRAAAPYQNRRQKNDVAIAIERKDLRQKMREKRIGNLIVFVVDASGSMGAGKRMVETKAAILSLLLDAYQKRDKIAMVAFRGIEADVLLPPTNSVELVYKLLEELPTGGKTPLSHGITMGYQMIESQLRKDSHTCPIMVLISDGKGNVSLSGGKPLPEAIEIATTIREDGRTRSVVIDVEKPGLINFGLAREISSHLGGLYFKIEDLKAETLVEVLRNVDEITSPSRHHSFRPPLS